jgi:hypothetical protein
MRCVIHRARVPRRTQNCREVFAGRHPIWAFSKAQNADLDRLKLFLQVCSALHCRGLFEREAAEEALFPVGNFLHTALLLE